MTKCALFSFLCLVSPGYAALFYVDSLATGTGNGKSWTDAWKSLKSVSGVTPSDTVYISGGSTSKTYLVTGGWTPAPAIYQTGQESGHNGLVVIDGGGQEFLITPGGNTTLSGYVSGSTDQHMKFQNAWDAHLFISSGTVDKLHITYVTDPACNRFLYEANASSVSNLEIDHCYIWKKYSGSSSGADDVFYLGGDRGGGRYHDNLVEMSVCSTLTPYGADGWKWGYGYSVYNNHVRVVLDPAYPGDSQQQHADVFQTAGSNIAIYNNWFENIGESVFFHCHGGTTSNDFSNIHFYNNVITQSFPASIAQVARGLDFEPQDSQGQSTFTDVLVANNVFSGITTIFVMRFHNAVRWTNCRVVNNLYLNCNDSGNSSWDSVAQAQIAVDHNSTAQSSWFADPLKNDFHPATGAPQIGTGATLTQFSTDKDGHPRGTTWSKGPYETALPPAPTPTPSPTPPAAIVADGTTLPVNFGVYPIDVTTAGNYILNASVQAPDEGKNSIYVDFDADPSGDDRRASDLNVGTGWLSQRLAWRGDSTTSIIEQAQFNPKVWTLSLGAHTLYIRQREPASIRSVTFALASPSPTPTPVPTPTPTPQPSPTPAPSPSPTASPSPTFEKWIGNLNNWIRANPPYHD